jgi:hypothetical protein
VIEWVPTASVDAEYIAWPLLFSEPLPRVELPSMNVTVPVGVPIPPVGVTVAVKVTDWPRVDGFADDATDAVVDDWLTTWLNAADVLPAKFVSPPKTAVIECVPPVSVDVEYMAWPLLFSDPLPSVELPSMNVTVPLGVPVPLFGVTVAVNVTDWPRAEGFNEDSSAALVAIFGACCSAEISLTNTPHDPVAHFEHVVWKAPVVVGNDDDVVEPAT